MAIGLPKDATGHEIPLDTVTLFNSYGDAYNIVGWMFDTDFLTYNKWANSWRAFSEHGIVLEPEKMYLTPPDSWEKLEEDIRRIGTDDCTWFCGYANESPVENTCPDSCKFFKGDEITCRKKLANDILSRICKLRGEDDA